MSPDGKSTDPPTIEDLEAVLPQEDDNSEGVEPQLQESPIHQAISPEEFERIMGSPLPETPTIEENNPLMKEGPAEKQGEVSTQQELDSRIKKARAEFTARTRAATAEFEVPPGEEVLSVTSDGIRPITLPTIERIKVANFGDNLTAVTKSEIKAVAVPLHEARNEQESGEHIPPSRESMEAIQGVEIPLEILKPDNVEPFSDRMRLIRDRGASSNDPNIITLISAVAERVNQKKLPVERLSRLQQMHAEHFIIAAVIFFHGIYGQPLPFDTCSNAYKKQFSSIYNENDFCIAWFNVNRQSATLETLPAQYTASCDSTGLNESKSIVSRLCEYVIMAVLSGPGRRGRQETFEICAGLYAEINEDIFNRVWEQLKTNSDKFPQG